MHLKPFVASLASYCKNRKYAFIWLTEVCCRNVLPFDREVMKNRRSKVG